jgi:hypothetical protein
LKARLYEITSIDNASCDPLYGLSSVFDGTMSAARNTRGILHNILHPHVGAYRTSFRDGGASESIDIGLVSNGMTICPSSHEASVGRP